MSVRLCVYALQRWLCALVSPLPCLSKWLSWVVQSCAETGLGCVFTDSPASGLTVCCRKIVLTGRQWQQLWRRRRRTTTKRRREGDRLHWAYRSCSSLSLLFFLTEAGHAPPSKNTRKCWLSYSSTVLAYSVKLR